MGTRRTRAGAGRGWPIRIGLALCAAAMTAATPALAATETLPPLNQTTTIDRMNAAPAATRAWLQAYASPTARARPQDRMLALSIIAMSYVAEGGADQALPVGRDYLALARQLNSKPDIAQALNVVGYYEMKLGDIANATRHLAEGARLGVAIRSQRDFSVALNILTQMQLQFGNYQDVLALSRYDAKIQRELGGKGHGPAHYLVLGRAYLGLGRGVEALAAVRQAEAAIQRGDDLSIRYSVDSDHATVAAQLKRYTEAEFHARKCLEAAAKLGVPRRESYSCEVDLARALQARGDQAGVTARLDGLRTVAAELKGDLARMARKAPSNRFAPIIARRDYHDLLSSIAELAGDKAGQARELALVADQNRTLQGAREAIHSGLAAYQIVSDEADLGIANLTAQTGQMLAARRRQWLLLGVGLVVLLGLSGVLFRWTWRRHVARRREERLAERIRIARDLHDTLLSEMAGTQMQLQAAALQARREDPALAEPLEDIVAQLGTAMTSVREVVWQIRSPAIERGDLLGALREWQEQLRRATQAEIAIEANDNTPDPAVRLTPAQVEDLFRIVQEAVGDAVRHAGASHVRIRLETGPRRTELAISDNGNRCAAPVQALTRATADGLRARAERIGAELVLGGTPEAGAELRVRLAG